MKSINLKKLILPNLPYLLFVYLFDKVGAAVRLSPGADASAKLLHLGDGFTAAFSSIDVYKRQGDFHGIFPRITGRSRKPGYQRLVNGNSLRILNAGPRCPALLEAVREGRGGALFQDGHAAGAAHAEDGNGSLSCGGGLRGDGAFRLNHGSMDSKKPPPSNLPPS